MAASTATPMVPTAPSTAPAMALTSAYPGLADYLGMELTEAEVRVLAGHGVSWCVMAAQCNHDPQVRLNMPEYLAVAIPQVGLASSYSGLSHTVSNT